MSYQSFRVIPSAGHIGAEIQGLDLSSELTPLQWREIHKAFLDYQVLFFHDQHLTRDQHIALGKHFGELHIHPMVSGPEGYPEIFPIEANKDSSDNPREVKAGKRAVNGNDWHSDVSCDEQPPLGSILYLKEVPAAGGDTLFASSYAAFEALSPAMQRFLEGLTARHSGEANYRYRYGNQRPQNRECFGYANGSEYPEAIHPVVRTHPETGRKGLFVNRGFTAEILELTPSESEALLEFIYRHQETPEFTTRFSWRNNSLAFWDNRCVQHRALFDYAGKTRRGERVTIKGDRPFLSLDSKNQHWDLVGS
ncbi:MULTISPECIES: TauD/TfdA dioxygenase family protein [Modicisalibacter]|uniref:TauD/TfdA family dioxygenase n=1 Tax=Modicisalibacter tunisiensis TaxID=390637 RepID=A0ABS7WUD9_9GAMM|nr:MULTISPECIES: TauD/TfdA family dioxygenase [Modicisalibacter]MBZ9540344.1 TauD/TfdA family dioxygenase [Modicisalibacter tunisiensis]MBZ9566222.1 TauD/TfdA family dioxygenase [Modicisalibacter tunisiensis]